MTKEPLYRLSLNLSFLTETDLEEAITKFRFWCEANKVLFHSKTYGFILGGRSFGELFLVSSEYFEGWKLSLIIQTLELTGGVSVRDFSSPEIPRNPAT